MVAGSKEEALEAEATKLKRDLITVKDEANTAKEKIQDFGQRAQGREAADGAKGQTASSRELKGQVRGYQGYSGLSTD